MFLKRLVFPLLSFLPLAACDGDMALDVGPALAAGGGIALAPALGLSGGHVCMAGGDIRAEDLALPENGDAGRRAALLLARRPLPADDSVWLLVIDGRDAAADHRVSLRGQDDWFFVAKKGDSKMLSLPAWLQPVTCAPAARAKLVAVKTGAKRVGNSYTLAVE